ncbi:MAG: 6,7-dimethyl-8-ribityllumazine synthase [Acidobacteriota bacterium]
MISNPSLQGRLDASGRRFAVVAARFNSRLVDLLLSGAVDCLERLGARPEDITVVRVPGAYELPLALDGLAKTGRYDALVALGVVIRGETPHFDYVCSECSKGITSVMRRHGLPVGFGVLTTDTSAQAAERCGGKVGNKGIEAAQAAVEMADLLATVGAGDEK